ncbi:cysteine proteinase [Jaminaea rosea]|uniref:ubiquitinyl hydrolase 1 n=1 Tax=Jaminaea rosea TaxID=1569628 RepID=A0A316UWN1_9BASI|nr:cysteine proteinase [Jaminaea rosea]PWN29706.1 cysteine proteinase [Jaminaea rosea]
MSFSWKGFLGVGSSSSSSSTANNASTSSAPNGQAANASTWGADDLEDDVPLWGLENFGNTCYANSIVQALYFCRPLRDAILSAAIESQPSADRKAASPPARPSTASVVRPAGPSRASTGLAKSRPSSSDGRRGSNPASPTLSSAKQQPPAEPDSVYITLQKLFASISKASDDHVAAASEEAAAAAAASSGTFSKPSALARGSKAAKASKAKAPARPTTAASTNTITPVQAGKKKDMGISAGPVDAIVVKSFLAAIRRQNTLFDTNAHQDAHEFLNILLNCLGDDIEEAQRKSSSTARDAVATSSNGCGKTVIHKLFEGVLTNETRCLTCEAVSSRDECFLDLSIDIEHNSSITSCLRQFSASETLRSRNKFFCDTCSGLQEAEKRMKIRKLPAVLALHMKRFKYEESKQRFVKLAYRVLFPFELRLFNTADDAEDPDRLYELFGIVVHIGAGPHHGHYVSIIKVGAKWAIFDDEAVHIIEQLDISKYFGGTPGMGSAYVLFYQAVDLDREALGLPTLEPSRAALEAMRAKMMAQAASAPHAYANGVSPQQHVVRSPTASEHSSPKGLHLPLSRSPADSVSSSGPGVEQQRSGSSTTSRPLTASPLPTTSPGADTPSGGGGFFSRFRSESTSINSSGNNNSLTQALESSRGAVDAAVAGSGGGSGSSAGGAIEGGRDRKGSLIQSSGPPGSSGGGGWRSPFRSRQTKRSGSVSETGSALVGQAPGANPSASSSTNWLGKMSDSMHSADSRQQHASTARLASPTRSKTEHDIDNDETGSASTHGSSAISRGGVRTSTAAGKITRSERSPSRLGPGSAGAAMTPGASPPMPGPSPGQSNGLLSAAAAAQPAATCMSPSSSQQHNSPSNGDGSDQAAATAATAPSPPKTSAPQPAPSMQSPSSPSHLATSPPASAAPPPTTTASQEGATPETSNVAAVENATHLPPSPTSQAYVQTGAFAPVLDRPLTKKEQQRIAKESRRISATSGFPGAGFDASAGAGAAPAGMVSSISTKAADGRMGLGKGLPPPSGESPVKQPSGQTPKRRSTLSRALGFGKNKG